MLDPYDGDLVKFFVDVKVQNPKLEGHSYVSYEIAIETNNPSFTLEKSAVWRRFSDFVVIHKLITKEFPSMKTPSLPPKSLFQDHFHPEFIEKRRKGLEEFVKKLVLQKIYLSSKALHLFLQSNHSVSEIKAVIQNKSVPPLLHDELLNNRFSNFYISCSSAENSTSLHSSPAEIEVNATSVTYNSPELSNTKSDINYPMGHKKVSFCEQVTVAQIHVD